MTKGRPGRLILAFALPLILSNLFQQCYNLVDTIVVGNFVGVNGLAAVGASTPITQLFVSMGGGASMGVSVLVGQYYGARDWKRLKSGVNTALLLFSGFSLLLLFVGLLISRPLLSALSTPAEVLADAQAYLNIYLLGLPFLFLYNTANAIFNGMGDSKKPLYFLIFSSLLNILLDYVFVAAFHWGVLGVAYATLIAQGLACLLANGALFRRLRHLAADSPAARFDRSSLSVILKVGVPTMLQLMSVSLGGLLVQSLVNGYGSDAIAGYSAALKVNALASMVINTLGSALSTFTAQNIGADQYDRPGQGIRSVVAVTLAYSLALIGVVFLFGRNIIAMFAGEEATEEMVRVGAEYLYWVTPGYLVFSLMNAFNGISRGAGYMLGFTFSTMMDITCRCLLSFLLNAWIGMQGIWLAIPLGWIVGLAIAIVSYRGGKWKRKVIS